MRPYTTIRWAANGIENKNSGPFGPEFLSGFSWRSYDSRSPLIWPIPSVQPYNTFNLLFIKQF